jgi:PadR family transcriptional regulator, regulatory protein PadR
MPRRPAGPPPLKPAAFHILLALAAHDSHGYAIMQTVREQSNGSVPLRTGSFYRHLAQLMADGYVAESSTARPEDDDPRRGAYYRLTARGHKALVQERARLAGLVEALDRLRPAPRGGA